jgi:hypothetical protein
MTKKKNKNAPAKADAEVEVAKNKKPKVKREKRLYFNASFTRTRNVQLPESVKTFKEAVEWILAREGEAHLGQATGITSTIYKPDAQYS